MQLDTFIIYLTSAMLWVICNHGYVHAGSNGHSTYPESSFCILKIDLEHSILPQQMCISSLFHDIVHQKTNYSSL